MYFSPNMLCSVIRLLNPEAVEQEVIRVYTDISLPNKVVDRGLGMPD